LKDYGETKSFNFPEWTIKVHSSRTNDIAGRILEHFAVEDVVIEDAEIEDVISDVFNQKKEENEVMTSPQNKK
jgi:ABC-type uncharacterized transport system ATPase subunit